MPYSIPRFSAVILFAVAFAFVESSVVVYLRDLYYPDGFVFPLKPIRMDHLGVELLREFSTILMLIAAGMLAGRTRWEKTAWFMIAFGIWDIFYYVWLKVLLGWPASLFEWDILFLIPLPWIGPVIAPILISLVLIVAGFLILRSESAGGFHPPAASWASAVLGTGVILFTFMRDTEAGRGMSVPEDFSYGLFALGLGFYAVGMVLAFRGRKSPAGDA